MSDRPRTPEDTMTTITEAKAEAVLGVAHRHLAAQRDDGIKDTYLAEQIMLLETDVYRAHLNGDAEIELNADTAGLVHEYEDEAAE